MSAFIVLGFVFFDTPVSAQIRDGAGSASANTVTGNVSPAGVQTSFKVRFVEFDNVYLSVGPGSVLSKGMKLLVRRSSGAGTSDAGEVVAELRVKSVSASSAICEVLTAEGVEKGDVAYLTPEEIATVTKQRPVSSASARQTALNSQPVTPSKAKMGIPAPPSTPSDNGKPVGATVQVVANPAAPNQQSTNQTPSATVVSVTPLTAKVPVVSAQASTPMKPNSLTQSIAAAQPPAPTQNQPAVTLPSIQQTIAVQASTASKAVSSSAATIASTTSQSATAAVQPPQTPAITQVNSSLPTSPVPQVVQRQAQSTNTSMQNAQLAQAPGLTTTQKNPSPEGAQVNDTNKASQVAAAAQPSNIAASSSPSQEIVQDSQDTVLPDVQTIFKIKFVAQDTVYLSAGTATGLTAGMKLIVKHSELDVNQNGTLAKASQAATIAELEVISVASSSAVCSVKNKTADIQPGDLAFMDHATAEALAEKRALSATRKFPQVVSFNEGDPLDEEVREEVPRPPLPEVNRIRGRFGFDYGDIRSSGAIVSNNSQIGLVVRTDFTRIGGSYWSLSGYWRGRLNNTSNAEQPTLQDLINRTYHLNLTYSNPTSPWVAGFGRLYLPWATSLDTIDGGYFGRKAGKHLLLGLFAGSTPDPTSWDYNPNRRIGGVFLNLEGGSFDSLRVSSTSGLALSTLNWQVDRPFIFFENGLYFKRYLSIYDSTQADDPRPIAGLNAVGPGLSRNFFTLRFQPFERLSFDVDHNYFRDVPTFDTALIATGLLDKYLFQGLSTGARVEPIRHITLYASVGKSSRTGDTSGAWNEMYGVTFAQIPKTGLHVDVRTSRFDSSFGSGKYRSVSISRNFTEILHLEAQVGQQFLTSQLTSQTESRFVNATLDSNLGRNYFIQGGYTVQRGGTFNYNQWTITFGYRFDNHMQGVGK